MNFKKLENNLLDMIQEQQVKIGYMSGVTRFYYPLQSLNRLLGTELTEEETKLETPEEKAHRKERERFMRQAITQAKKAEKLMEVPIGCVIVYEGKVVARGYNRRNTDKNTLSHAELNAIRKASKKLGDWRLEGCTLYVTLEPCQMCAGAIVQARVSEVVIGSMNPKAGCAGSILNMLEMHEFNHQVKVERGVLKEECSEMLSAFFRRLRVVKKKKKEERERAEEGKE